MPLYSVIYIYTHIMASQFYTTTWVCVKTASQSDGLTPHFPWHDMAFSLTVYQPFSERLHSYIASYITITSTLWSFNIAMGNGPLKQMVYLLKMGGSFHGYVAMWVITRSYITITSIPIHRPQPVGQGAEPPKFRAGTSGSAAAARCADLTFLENEQSMDLLENPLGIWHLKWCIHGI